MYSVELKELKRTYSNNGQHAEQVARYTLTGVIAKADNIPFNAGADCGTIQIKSARATICKGTDIKAHLESDKATEYGYVTDDFKKMYVMTKAEYLKFATLFATITKESQKNGGAEKMRFKNNKMLIKYLENA